MSIKTQAIGSASAAAALLTITGTTNATPIVATFGAGHDLRDGERIAVAGITGNTNANGEWTLRFTGANTAQLVGSTGNGVHAGTPRVAVICDRTPVMRNHAGVMATFGNLVGTVDLEAYESYDDFAAGANNSGASAPLPAAAGVTNSAGSTSTPAKSSVALAATNAGFESEIRLPRYLRAVVSAFTSGTVTARVQA